MTDQALDVFKDEASRSLRRQDPRDVEEQCAARVVETFAVADDAEGLAGEAREQQIVVWDVVFVDLRNVAARGLAKVGSIRFPCVGINIAGEDA